MSKPNDTDTGIESRRLWGEMEDGEAESDEIGLSAAERDALCRMQKPLHLEGPKIHQPSTFRIPPGVNSASSSQETLVTNGIRLRQYINAAAAYMEQSGLAGLPMQPIPQMPAVVQERVRCSPFEEALSSRSRFARGVQCGPRSLTSMPLGRRTALRDLRKASAALLAFNGIHNSTSAALQILVEVVADYMGRLCRRIAEDKEYCQLADSVNGFPDPMERVFREHLGLRSVLSLQDYYERDVRAAHARIAADARDSCLLLSQGGAISSSAGPHSVPGVLSGQGATAVYVVGSNDSNDVPEIHFPASEEGGDSVVSAMMLDQPQLETGLQMLHSLEQISQQQQQQQDEQDANAALLLRTVSPGAAEVTRPSKRRRN